MAIQTLNEFDQAAWKPRTELGRKVKNGEIKHIDEILSKGLTIMEPEIVDTLMPDLESDLILVGQSKGKFGGGQRRVFRQTQKKTREGNKPKFSTVAVVGDRNGHVGIGFGKSKETVPAREKALRNAKLNIFKIARGSGSWESATTEPHSIPFKVTGKTGSIELEVMPAPKGKGLVIEKECAKVLGLAGVSDVWAKSRGQTKNKLNMIKALEAALRKLSSLRVREKDRKRTGYVSGSTKDERREMIEELEEASKAVEQAKKEVEKEKPEDTKSEKKTEDKKDDKKQPKKEKSDDEKDGGASEKKEDDEKGEKPKKSDE